MRLASCQRLAYASIWAALIAGCATSGSDQTPTATASPSPSPQASSSATNTPLSPSPTASVADTALPSPVSLFRLTDDLTHDEDPVWSPDSQRIAFVSDRSGRFEVYAIDVDGSNLTKLTEDNGIDFKESPTWSPDGERIAFAALFDVYQIHAFDVEASYSVPFDILGDLVYPMTNRVWNSAYPAWSPDGSRIAFTTDDTFADRQVYTLDLVDGSKEQVTTGPVPAIDPAWSPDGSRLAFVSNGEGNFQIYTVNADGSDTRRLTNHTAFDSWPSWSPEGRYIVFSSNWSGSLDLYVMESDGSNVRRLEAGGGENFDPEWSPVGRYIAFVSTRDGNREIYRMHAPQFMP